MFDEEQGVENESFIVLSKDRNDDLGTLGFVNEKFRSVQAGQTYNLDLFFLSGETLDTGWGEREFTGAELDDGKRGLVVQLEWSDLREDMRDEESVGFFRGEELVDQFPLNGSAKAISQLDRCLVANVSTGLRDPFE
jgi:hypothetical protein